MTWRPLPQDGPSEPKQVGEGLDSLVRRLGAPGAASLSRLFDHWADVVGAATADHCRPVSLSRGVLVVAVDEPAWASHVRLSSGDLLANVERVVGPGLAQRVEVRVRPRGRGPLPRRW